MRTPSPSLWFGIYGKEYITEEPAFFESNDFPWAATIKDNYPAILDTLTSLIENSDDQFEPYFDDALQYPPRNWKTIGFLFWGKKNNLTLGKHVAIEKIFSEIPGLVTASFNMLEPNSRIEPHFGETNAVFRIHLGIKIPGSLPKCGFTVKGESRSWKEGEMLVFLDANRHAAINHTAERRYILLLDIIRPEFENRKRWVCTKSLGMLSVYYLLARLPPSWSTVIQQKAKGIHPYVFDVALFPLQAIWYIYFLAQDMHGFVKRIRH